MGAPVLNRNQIAGTPDDIVALGGKVPQLVRNGQVLTTLQPRPLLVTQEPEAPVNDVAAAVSFETVSRNLSAVGAVLSYSGQDLASVTYANGVIKSFTYGPDGLASVTLSGAIPDGIATVKTLTYTGGNLTAITYT